MNQFKKQAEKIRQRFGATGTQLRVSDKALSYQGQLNQTPVFLKILTTDDPKWINRFAAEVWIYQYLRDLNDPAAYEITPRLIEADISCKPYYLVMEWKENAQNYSPMRWAEKEIPERVAVKMGEVLYNFHRLMQTKTQDIGLETVTAAEIDTKVKNYSDELPHSYLESTTRNKITQVLPEWMDEFVKCRKQIIHGDPLFTNFMSSDDHLYLVDWEYAVVSHPSHDLASFWVTSSLAPRSRAIAINRYQELHPSWDESFNRVYNLFKLRYTLRELSQMHKSRGYHTTFTAEGKQQIINDQIKTLKNILTPL